MIRVKAVRHVNASSRNVLKCSDKNSKTKAMTTTAKVKIKRERIMILSLFLCLEISCAVTGKSGDLQHI